MYQQQPSIAMHANTSTPLASRAYQPITTTTNTNNNKTPLKSLALRILQDFESRRLSGALSPETEEIGRAFAERAGRALQEGNSHMNSRLNSSLNSDTSSLSSSSDTGSVSDDGRHGPDLDPARLQQGWDAFVRLAEASQALREAQLEAARTRADLARLDAVLSGRGDEEDGVAVRGLRRHLGSLEGIDAGYAQHRGSGKWFEEVGEWAKSVSDS